VRLGGGFHARPLDVVSAWFVQKLIWILFAGDAIDGCRWNRVCAGPPRSDWAMELSGSVGWSERREDELRGQCDLMMVSPGRRRVVLCGVRPLGVRKLVRDAIIRAFTDGSGATKPLACHAPPEPRKAKTPNGPPALLSFVHWSHECAFAHIIE